jgi:hypothetical protein
MFCGEHLTGKCTFRVSDLELECAMAKIVLIHKWYIEGNVELKLHPFCISTSGELSSSH